MIDSGKVKVNLIAIKNINNENYISICDKIVLVSDTDRLTFEDWTSISQIVIGCTKIVYRDHGPEGLWSHSALKLLKPSKEHLVRLSAYERSKYSPEDFSPKDIESQFSEYVEKVDHSTASNSLKKLVKVNVLKKSYENNERQRKPGKPRKDDISEKLPGPKWKYAQSENEMSLRKFVARLVPR